MIKFTIFFYKGVASREKKFCKIFEVFSIFSFSLWILLSLLEHYRQIKKNIDKNIDKLKKI